MATCHAFSQNFTQKSTQSKLSGLNSRDTLLRKNIPLAYDSVTLENIQNHFRKVRHFMFGYLEGLVPGQKLDEALKKVQISSEITPKNWLVRVINCHHLVLTVSIVYTHVV